jgi:hypothetical protein
MTKFKTFAAVALAATTLTTVAATGSAFAWGGGYGGHGGFYNHSGFGRYDHGYRGYGFFRGYGNRGYGYGYPSFSYYSDCSYWRRWSCGY